MRTVKLKYKGTQLNKGDVYTYWYNPNNSFVYQFKNDQPNGYIARINEWNLAIFNISFYDPKQTELFKVIDVDTLHRKVKS